MEKNKVKKILTMQDLSCVGQCSLTVALPILSAYGVETCVLPTAILSNHTMFNSWSYLDLTEETENILCEWKNNGFKFDGFLLGYLGKKSLMDVAERCFDNFSSKNAPIIIDPVFADNGKLYGGFDLDYVDGMRGLLKRADIILPNVTEACFLTDTPYKSDSDSGYVKRLAIKLAEITNATVIITGIEKDGKIGEFIYSNGISEEIMLEKLPSKRHGTGDIFASVFTACYLGGKSLSDSCWEAGQFVADCLKQTDDNHFYGVNFEKTLMSKTRIK